MISLRGVGVPSRLWSWEGGAVPGWKAYVPLVYRSVSEIEFNFTVLDYFLENTWQWCNLILAFSVPHHSSYSAKSLTKALHKINMGKLINNARTLNAQLTNADCFGPWILCQISSRRLWKWTTAVITSVTLVWGCCYLPFAFIIILGRIQKSNYSKADSRLINKVVYVGKQCRIIYTASAKERVLLCNAIFHNFWMKR